MLENPNVRLTDENMSTQDIILKMCDGNIGAVNTLIAMYNRDGELAVGEILQLDYLGIYGVEIYKLWHYCCGCDPERLSKTLDLLCGDTISNETFKEHMREMPPRAFVW